MIEIQEDSMRNLAKIEGVLDSLTMKIDDIEATTNQLNFNSLMQQYDI